MILTKKVSAPFSFCGAGWIQEFEEISTIGRKKVLKLLSEAQKYVDTFT